MGRSKSGLKVEVEWIATNDGRVRDKTGRYGQKRHIGQPFNVGGEIWPSIQATPEQAQKNTINCRCVLGCDADERIKDNKKPRMG